jgi:hypothetical protein
MAIPQADYRDFSCSDGFGNPKTVQGLGVSG